MRMRILLVFVFVVFFPGLRSQTRFYLAFPDGTCDSSSYIELVQSSGKVIAHTQTTSFRRDTVRDFRFIFEGNRINGEFRHVTKGEAHIETIVVNLGWINEKKEIIDGSIEVNGVDSPSAYIRYSKIYDMDQKLVGYISGNEVHAAGLYLLRP